MNKKHSFFALLVFLLLSAGLRAQDSLSTKTVQLSDRGLMQRAEKGVYDPLAPAKAAFYSAVLPGLGQAYNHSYWKIPIVYAGLGVSIYFYADNNKKYHEYRRAYKRRIAGFDDDEFQGRISDRGLIEAQKQFKKNKEISIFAAVIIYALNIVDANVEAHLRQFNVSKNLTLQPDYDFDGLTGRSNYGLSLNLTF